MLTVTEAEAAAIRAAMDEGGELAAVAELRRLFPGVAGHEDARTWARAIAGWQPIHVPLKAKRPAPARSRRDAW